MLAIMRWASLGVCCAIALIISVAPAMAEDLTAPYRRAQLLYEGGRYDQAEQAALKLLESVEKLQGKDRIGSAPVLNVMALIYLKQARFEEAILLHKRALAIREKALGPEHIDVAETLNNLAVALLSLSRYAEALPALERALAIREKHLGPSHPDVAKTLRELADFYAKQRKFGEALPLFERALKIQEKELGTEHADVAETLNDMAVMFVRQTRYNDAKPMIERALAIREKALGPEHPDVARSLESLGEVYREQGRFDEAAKRYGRALFIRERAFGPSHLAVARILHNMAIIEWEQGRYGEAIALNERTLAIKEKFLGTSSEDVAATLANLANVYVSMGRYEDAIPVYRRALSIREKVSGPSHPDVTVVLSNLAEVYRYQHRYAEAIELNERALAIREKALGPFHPDLAYSLGNLALIHLSQGQLEKGTGLLERALAIEEKALGPSHPSVAGTLGSLAEAYRKQKRYEDAWTQYQRALTIRVAALGPSHPYVALTLDDIGVLYGTVRRYAEAYPYMRRAVAILTARVQAVAGKTHSETEGNRFATYSNFAWAAYGLALQEPAQGAQLANEALDAVQRASANSAGAALTQMAVRLGAGDTDLARSVREQQDQAARWRELDRSLIAELSNSPDRRDATVEATLRKQRDDAETAITDMGAKLQRQFPEYAALSNPRPLSVTEVKKLLGEKEVLVVYLVGENLSYVWAITREELSWQKIGVGSKVLDVKVAAIRKGLDLGALASGAAEPVDLSALHDLYNLVLAPVQDVLKDKTHLLIVPAGTLTALPFHMLVTAPAKDGDYAGAEWLLKRFATTTLPSVSSLKALRILDKGTKASKPLIGYGDPQFGRPAEKKSDPLRVASARAYTAFYRGTRADRETLIQGLPQLPGTREELIAVAKSLGIPESEIRLGKSASEEAVKTTRLDEYRIIYFATHGLVAGDIDGLGEPALALSIPEKQTDLDDGLLTASEVAQLKLNADWVVLSACNTAAGDKPGAEALSGLARAFFYAGARALLVTHWPADDNAAARIASGTFAQLQKNPSIGRAEALRQSMLAMIGDTSSPTNAYPGVWAPFVVVGEGGAGR